MNWLFGTPKNNLTETTPLQAQKAKQIGQLRKFNQNVTEVTRDVEYRVGFLVNGAKHSLIVNLPSQFPKDRPNVSVTPPVSHSWVNDNSVVTGCPGLNNFSMHSDLSSVIRQITDEFSRNPPQPKNAGSFSHYPYPGVNPSLAGYMNPGQRFNPYPSPPKHNYITQVAGPTLPPRQTSPAHPTPAPTSVPSQVPTHSCYPNYSTEQTSIGGYGMPEIPSVFPQLRDMSLSELQQLEQDEDKLLDLIRTLPEVEKISTDRQSMQQNNEILAKDNLAKKPIFEETKNHLLEKFDHLNELRRNFDHLSTRQDELRHQFDTDAIRDNLKVAALQAEEESETIADNFLDGKLGVEEFLIKYKQKRSLYHTRRAKEEKLLEHSPDVRPVY